MFFWFIYSHLFWGEWIWYIQFFMKGIYENDSDMIDNINMCKWAVDDNFTIYFEDKMFFHVLLLFIYE